MNKNVSKRSREILAGENSSMSKFKSRSSIFENIRPSLRKSAKSGRNDANAFPNTGKQAAAGFAFQEEKSNTAGNQYGMAGEQTGTESSARNAADTASSTAKAGTPGSQGNIG